jgi:hypothetical protein
MMVITMQRINNFGSHWRFGYPMKNKTMGYVFKQRPKEHTTKKYKQYGGGRIIILCGGEVNDITEYGNIHSPNHQRMGFCQRLQKIILEQPGLTLIMNFFEMHVAKIRKGVTVIKVLFN